MPVGGAQDQTVGLETDGADVLDEAAELPHAQRLGAALNAVAPPGRQAWNKEALIAGCRRHKPVKEASQMGAAVADLPCRALARRVAAEASELEGTTVLFVKGDLRAKLRLFSGQQLAEIQLVAQQPEAGDVAACGQRCRAQRLCVGRG